MNRRLMIAATAFAILLAVGACGRKGGLEPPPGVSPDMAKKTTAPHCANAATEQRPIDAPGGGGSTSGNPNRMPDMTAPPC